VVDLLDSLAERTPATMHSNPTAMATPAVVASTIGCATLTTVSA
jgi:hypothetical protein